MPDTRNTVEGERPVTFNEILNQTVTMLQQHGRVSYHALKRRFDLDDTYLNDLTYKLIEIH